MLLFSFPVFASDNVVAEPEYIAPLENTDTLSESELNDYLGQMGFTTEETSFISLALKKQIVSDGGIKIKAEKLNPVKTIIDEEGKVVSSNQFSTRSVQEGNFSLYGFATKNSSPNSSENSYNIYAQYNWAKAPTFCFTDTLGMAWQSQATPYGAPYSVHNWRSDPQLFQYTNKIQKQENDGDAVEINIISTGDQSQDGYLKQEIRVAKSYAGQTGSVALGYAHKLIPGAALAILNFFSVDFSGAAIEDFTDRFNFTY
ncbi:hypothetical protein QW71_25095 [Paenibacillus sp. IHB B 3415]|uniref:hypothetical protein n=1 Tax=Paenibacillus sp. IHB B 3415 TaxID=867080 RepID=UPI0005734F84|nr:hypothetical protein [Paenibacillus sp. IHB B 3415]KHL93135.1 hypothetical protein QW71_25095 [Paenibacillus sp. IHB B 3415]